ncbi:MAG: site-2 protease family protein, partial [Actinobacteria bacterium]|nr:site-2 protease family protein [Actinomycetota bacterium]
VAVIFAGPGANLLLAIALFAGLFLAASGGFRLGFVLGATKGGEATSIVQEVAAETPAASAGLQTGDRIVEIDGSAVSGGEIRAAIGASEGRPLQLTVLREGETVELTPVRPEDTGDYGVVESIGESLRVTALVTKEIGATVGRLVTGSGRDEISSPVGIVQGSSQAAEQGADNYLWVLGLISLSLALLNLLPLLPLDGGHIAFSLIEGLRGKAVAREVYERVSVIGIAVVLLLFFIGLSNDIGRLGS